MPAKRRGGKSRKRTKNHYGRRPMGVRRTRTKAAKAYVEITSSTLFPGVYWKGIIQ